MKYHTKLLGIYIVGVISPIILMFINGSVAQRVGDSWSHNNLNLISKGLLLISIFVCAIITIINYREQKVSFWYTVSIATAVGLGLLLYVGNSVSSFGF